MYGFLSNAYNFIWQNAFQGVLYDVSVSSKFDMFIVLIIFMNMIAMGVDHYNMNEFIKDVMDTLNIIFTTVFTLEAVVKIIGLRHHYFKQPWNVFDFVVVIVSLLGNNISFTVVNNKVCKCDY